MRHRLNGRQWSIIAKWATGELEETDALDRDWTPDQDPEQARVRDLISIRDVAHEHGADEED